MSIEIAAAILIVGGLTGIIGTLTSAFGGDPAAADPSARPVIMLLVALNLLTVIVGFLVRRGMAWIACINAVAVLLFIEFTAVPGGSATAVLLVVLDAFVFITVTMHRAWFEWRPLAEDPVR